MKLRAPLVVSVKPFVAPAPLPEAPTMLIGLSEERLTSPPAMTVRLSALPVGAATTNAREIVPTEPLAGVKDVILGAIRKAPAPVPV